MRLLSARACIQLIVGDEHGGASTSTCAAHASRRASPTGSISTPAAACEPADRGTGATTLVGSAKAPARCATYVIIASATRMRERPQEPAEGGQYVHRTRLKATPAAANVRRPLGMKLYSSAERIHSRRPADGRRERVKGRGARAKNRFVIFVDRSSTVCSRGLDYPTSIRPHAGTLRADRLEFQGTRGRRHVPDDAIGQHV
jgi:hypothetical protein